MYSKTLSCEAPALLISDGSVESAMEFFINMFSHGLLLLGIGVVVIAALPYSLALLPVAYFMWRRS